MKTINTYLDEIKTKHQIKRDSELARRLNVTRSNITHYRRGPVLPDDQVCLRIAKLLDLDPADVLTNIHAQRAPDPATRSAWEALNRRIASTTGFFLGLSVTYAAAGLHDLTRMCIMSNRKPISHST